MTVFFAYFMIYFMLFLYMISSLVSHAKLRYVIMRFCVVIFHTLLFSLSADPHAVARDRLEPRPAVDDGGGGPFRCA